MPLQAYFRINSENAGQFERTLDHRRRGFSQVHYIEGCSAPVYTNDSLHSAVVEIVVKPSARVTYTTIQNWSPNVYNLVTKRARVEAEGHMEWIDGNIGSKLTMKYPSVYLVGPKATGEVLVGRLRRPRPAPGCRRQDGARRPGDHLQDRVEVDQQGRRHHHIPRPGAGRGGRLRLQESRAVRRADPRRAERPATRCRTWKWASATPQIGHEATVSKIADEQLFYLMSRGLSQEQAMSMVVNGFIEPITRTLPMEYAVEWSRLIELQMEGSVG